MASSLQQLLVLVIICVLVLCICLLCTLLFAPEPWSEERGVSHDPGADAGRAGPEVPDLIARFWRSASAVRGDEAASDVLTAIVNKIQGLNSPVAFIGETALVHAAVLCAEAEHDEAQTMLVYSADKDLGQVAYMLGSRLPFATVLTLHPTSWESYKHAAFLDQMRLPGGLMLHEVVSAGVWAGATDLRRLAATPAVVDVQVAIGTRMGQSLLEPAVLRQLLSLARWTLISFPLEALEDQDGDPITRALALRDDGSSSVMKLSADVGTLGIVRVPATQEMQALFLVWSWHVERRVHTEWHRQPGSRDRFKVRFGIDRNATIESREGFAEAAGFLLETLLALGLPLSERMSLMAAALSDVRAGPANWVVCCGGIWQWSSGAEVDELPVASIGVVAYLSCAFGLAPRAVEMYQRTCTECAACDERPLEQNTTAEICIQCAECLAQMVAPKLASSGSSKTLPKPDSKLGAEQLGFIGPFADDVPGLGDLGNVQVLNAHECASLCQENPRCQSFEFSAASGSLLETIRNCQLASGRTRSGAQYGDFALYLKQGVPSSVDEGVNVLFDTGPVEIEPDSIFDTGRPFGAAGAGTTPRLGWACGDGSLRGAEISQHGHGPTAMTLHDALRCHGGAIWQIGVPPGLYEVELILQQGSGGTDDELSECTAEGEKVRLQRDGLLPPSPEEIKQERLEGEGPPPSLAPDETAGRAAAAAQMEALFAASLGPPTYIGRADRVPVGQSGVMRLVGCAHLGQKLTLKRVELRRTQQDCPLPQRPSDAELRRRQFLERDEASAGAI